MEEDKRKRKKKRKEPQHSSMLESVAMRWKVAFFLLGPRDAHRIPGYLMRMGPHCCRGVQVHKGVVPAFHFDRSLVILIVFVSIGKDISEVDSSLELYKRKASTSQVTNLS